MKKQDIIFAIICGLSVAWIALDFVPKYGWIFFVILPILSVCGLLLCDILGRKFLFIHQAGKFALAGAFADVIDIKVYQFLFLLLPIPLLLKTFSFIIATIVKYIADKHWAFNKPEKDGMKKEIIQFFMVACGGLIINVVSFYCFSQIDIGLPAKIWTELSIILAALVVATWNFLGYKFIVFKK